MYFFHDKSMYILNWVEIKTSPSPHVVFEGIKNQQRVRFGISASPYNEELIWELAKHEIINSKPKVYEPIILELPIPGVTV